MGESLPTDERKKSGTTCAFDRAPVRRGSNAGTTQASVDVAGADFGQRHYIRAVRIGIVWIIIDQSFPALANANDIITAIHCRINERFQTCVLPWRVSASGQVVQFVLPLFSSLSIMNSRLAKYAKDLIRSSVGRR